MSEGRQLHPRKLVPIILLPPVGQGGATTKVSTLPPQFATSLKKILKGTGKSAPNKEPDR